MSAVTDEMVEAATTAFNRAINEPILIKCDRCAGTGYHHGFGEDGNDPDWCLKCGGNQFDVAPGEEARAIRTALEAALSSLPESGEAVAWQPIETAPRDGTTVDLWGFAGPHTRRAADAQWGDVIDYAGTIRKGWCHGETSGFEPTHWMRVTGPNSSPVPDQGEVEMLRKALEPFVHACAKVQTIPDTWSDNDAIKLEMVVKVGHIRRARAALEGK